MALIFLIKCRCGRKHTIYFPNTLLVESLQKKGKNFDPDFLEAVERLDNTEQTRREVEMAKHLAESSSSYQFTDLAKDKAIFCECGKLIDVENLFFGGKK